MSTNDHLTARNPLTTQLGLTILRVFLGAMLTIQGTQKILAGPQGFVANVQAMGAPLPEISSWLVILGEFGLGIALIFGVFTRIAGGLAALMMFLIWLATAAGDPLFTDAPGITAGSLWFYFVAALVLAFAGGGTLSVDKIFAAIAAKGRGRAASEEPQTVTV